MSTNAELKWFQFNLKSGNFVIVKSTDRKLAKEKFEEVWPKNPTKVVAQGYMYGEGAEEVPFGAVEELAA